MTYSCPRCKRETLIDAYDDETAEHGYFCFVCMLVLRDSDLPDEPPLSNDDVERLKAQDDFNRLIRKWQDDVSQRDALSDDEVNRMADEAALDDLCASRGRR